MRLRTRSLLALGLALTVAAPLPRITPSRPSTATSREPEGRGDQDRMAESHVFFYIDVRDEETGKVTNWALEMGAPAVIQRNGWKRNTMKIGDLVIVTGTKAKNGKPLANARSVVMASTGQKLGAGSSEGAHRSNPRWTAKRLRDEKPPAGAVVTACRAGDRRVAAGCCRRPGGGAWRGGDGQAGASSGGTASAAAERADQPRRRSGTEGVLELVQRTADRQNGQRAAHQSAD